MLVGVRGDGAAQALDVVRAAGRAVQQVAPRRAADLRAARNDAVARSVSFPVYGLAHWDGTRMLAGHSWEGPPPRVTSLALGHGDVSRRSGPWVLVETAERDRGDQHSDDALADGLRDQAAGEHEFDPSGLNDTALLAHLRDVRRARAARPRPQWHLGALLFEGKNFSIRWAADGEHWFAHLLLGDLSLARIHRRFSVCLTRKCPSTCDDDLAEGSRWQSRRALAECDRLMG